MPEPLLTVKEVSEVLKTNVNYVHELRKSGVLPFLKLGSFKCRQSALEEFLEKYEGYDLSNPHDVKKIDVDGDEEAVEEQPEPEGESTADKNTSCGIVIDLFR